MLLVGSYYLQNCTELFVWTHCLLEIEENGNVRGIVAVRILAP